MVPRLANLWFGLVLQIGPLRPEEGDGASGLERKKERSRRHPVRVDLMFELEDQKK